MVLFDVLRISDDGKRMYINFHVNQADYFKDLTLDSITICTADKVSETDPYQPTEDYIYKKVYTKDEREDAIVLQPVDMNENYSKSNFSSDLFFVYVKVKGTPDQCTPCRLDEEITLGVTFDTTLLYQQAMGYTKDLLKDCTVPIAFADFILQWNAFKASIETEHYVSAIKFWKLLFDKKESSWPVNNTKPCGCHG
jgi:hypothetical protein